MFWKVLKSLGIADPSDVLALNLTRKQEMIANTTQATKTLRNFEVYFFIYTYDFFFIKEIYTIQIILLFNWLQLVLYFLLGWNSADLLTPSLTEWKLPAKCHQLRVK